MGSHQYHRLVSLSLAIACLSISSVAQGRSQRNLAYRSQSAWNAAVRMLRVDMGFELVERDQDARFVLFQYTDGEHSFPGSLEVVERSLEDGRQGVRVIVSVPAMPSYVELHLLDRLERKLQEEVGPPLPAPERPQSRATRTAPEADEEAEPQSEEEPEEED